MHRRTLFVLYTLLVGAPALGVILLIAGNFSAPQLSDPTVATSREEATPGLLSFVVEVIAVLIAAHLTGNLFRYVGQPRVVGEMLAGILLGPSVFGAMAPAASALLFPTSGLPLLNALSQLGLIIFMFLVGLALDPGELRRHGHSALLISHVSIAVPVFLGVALAAQLYDKLASPGVAFSGFALFMGAAMGITAFPVLARILAERGMLRSPAGTLATACAAVDDVTGWSLLAVIVVIVRGPSSSHPLWLTVAGPALFVLVMIGVVRPRLRYVVRPSDPPSDRTVAWSILLAFASAAATEYLGIHLLFGAFLGGAIMPRRPIWWTTSCSGWKASPTFCCCRSSLPIPDSALRSDLCTAPICGRGRL